jgi:dUTP pyrophosphatase
MEEEKFSEEELNDLLNSFDVSDIDNINFDQMNEYFGFDVMGIEQEAEDLENEKLEFKFKKLNSDAITPSYVYESDSGFDLYSSEEKWIFPLDRSLISTGIHFDIPQNYELQIRSKSGLALNQGLMVLNSPGTVDQGYLGEIKVILFNTTKEKVKIQKNQKIAQGVLCPVVSGKWVDLVEVGNFEKKDRGDNGFGSSGI